MAKLLNTITVAVVFATLAAHAQGPGHLAPQLAEEAGIAAQKPIDEETLKKFTSTVVNEYLDRLATCSPIALDRFRKQLNKKFASYVNESSGNHGDAAEDYLNFQTETQITEGIKKLRAPGGHETPLATHETEYWDRQALAKVGTASATWASGLQCGKKGSTCLFMCDGQNVSIEEKNTASTKTISMPRTAFLKFVKTQLPIGQVEGVKSCGEVRKLSNGATATVVAVEMSENGKIGKYERDDTTNNVWAPVADETMPRERAVKYCSDMNALGIKSWHAPEESEFLKAFKNPISQQTGENDQYKRKHNFFLMEALTWPEEIGPG